MEILFDAIHAAMSSYPGTIITVIATAYDLIKQSLTGASLYKLSEIQYPHGWESLRRSRQPENLQKGPAIKIGIIQKKLRNDMLPSDDTE